MRLQYSMSTSVSTGKNAQDKWTGQILHIYMHRLTINIGGGCGGVIGGVWWFLCLIYAS